MTAMQQVILMLLMDSGQPAAPECQPRLVPHSVSGIRTTPRLNVHTVQAEGL